MTRFVYKAKQDPMQIIQGDLEAESVSDAVFRLQQLGYFPLEVNAQTAQNFHLSFFPKKVKPAHLILFTSQLATLVDSGVTVMEALNSLSKNNPSVGLKTILIDMIRDIKEGSSLSDSMKKYPNIFSSLYIALVYAGETSGKLKETLKRLSEYLEKAQNYKRSLVDSLIYPFFVIFTGFLTIFALLFFVVPKIVMVFKEMGQALPLPTQILIFISSFLIKNSFFIVLFLGIVWALAMTLLKDVKNRSIYDRVKIQIPFFGPLLFKAQIGRLSRVLSLLYSSGIPLASALQTSISIVDNEFLKQKMKMILENIFGGASFSEALKQLGIFPEMAVQMIMVGEKTGNLDQTLSRIAEDYESEVDGSLKIFAKILEPMVILIVGLVVGFIVISMLLPIFEINFLVR